MSIVSFATISTNMRRIFVSLAIISLASIAWLGSLWQASYWLLIAVIPLICLGVYDMLQRKHTITSIYPVIGHLRYLFESIRPEIQQYFVESNLNGVPFSREYRELVYQRAKGQQDTRAFGTQFDVYHPGYEWVNHSLAPKHVSEDNLKLVFGGAECLKPYSASPLNISAMSFGALSQNAILALNRGASIGGFAHNTGEGGISPHHLKHGGDLIWQIGTGYFGCRDDKGNFDETLFTEKATMDAVKMVEIKLSQGAKPGHGGILPAIKLTREIADIRHVPMGQDVVSPPSHTAFNSPTELLHFVDKLRELSQGKPVGFKLCLGVKEEFLAICKAMLETGITPDFITVDGAEGGTGAAPVEFSNAVGTPLREGLVFVHSALIGIGLRDRIRIIASGKAISAFHVLGLLALGADSVNAARAMMFALGCIQSLSCNKDTCPTGIATQNPNRYKSLDVNLKAVRVANYHAAMMKNLAELLGASGLEKLSDLRPWQIHRRISAVEVKTYAEIYPVIAEGCLLDDKTVPDSLKLSWAGAAADHW